MSGEHALLLAERWRVLRVGSHARARGHACKCAGSRACAGSVGAPRLRAPQLRQGHLHSALHEVRKTKEVAASVAEGGEGHSGTAWLPLAQTRRARLPTTGTP